MNFVMQSTPDAITGPVYDTIHQTLRDKPEYQQFRHGLLSPQAFHALVDGSAAELVAKGALVGDLPFVKRLPSQQARIVAEILDDLFARGMLPTHTLDPHQLVRASELAMTYHHGPFKTYIYPEEGLLLAALAAICRPTNVIFLGAYYGYWAQWLIPTVAENGGRITLVDPDERSCAVATRNILSSSHADAVQVVIAPGEDHLAGSGEFYDFVVLDAENPRDHLDPQLRGKGVYASLLRACLPRMTEDAVLVCHNILFADSTRDPAFDGIIERNHQELGPFMQLTHEAFSFFEYATTEGVGVGRRSTGRSAALAIQDGSR
jgi:predicted O-methyltransferase YrrM